MYTGLYQKVYLRPAGVLVLSQGTETSSSQVSSPDCTHGLSRNASVQVLMQSITEDVEELRVVDLFLLVS